jgi:glycerol-1-phosphate dehydrogenase [NAD(P)+]
MTHSTDLRSLFGQSFACECGQAHEIPTRDYVYDNACLARLPDILASMTPARSAPIVCDARTAAIAGEDVARTLAHNGWSAPLVVLPDVDGHSPVCDEQTHAWTLEHVPRGAAYVAAGSGVVNDLTKWLAFERESPYLVVASAASMNGYAAANVAPSIKGVKGLVFARAPIAILADPQVIAGAPYEMTAAGIGDVLAKSVSVSDWCVNHLLRNEHICPVCAHAISAIEPLYVNGAHLLPERDPATLHALFDALVFTGVAMTMIGTSAPASGGEHLFSHTLDMMTSVDGVPHDLHGRQVGLGTVVAAALYERVLASGWEPITSPPDHIDERFWGRLAVPVAAEYAQKHDTLARVSAQLGDDAMRERLNAAIKPFRKPPGAIKDILARAQAATSWDAISCSRERVLAAVLHMHEIRKRPTIVDIAWLCGVLPGAADDIIDEWLAP